MKLNRLTNLIMLALLMGIIVGYACNTFAASPAQAKEIASYFGILTDIFLRLIKMIIAPVWPALAILRRLVALAQKHSAGSSALPFVR